LVVRPARLLRLPLELSAPSTGNWSGPGLRLRIDASGWARRETFFSPAAQAVRQLRALVHAVTLPIGPNCADRAQRGGRARAASGRRCRGKFFRASGRASASLGVGVPGTPAFGALRFAAFAGRNQKVVLAALNRLPPVVVGDVLAGASPGGLPPVEQVRETRGTGGRPKSVEFGQLIQARSHKEAPSLGLPVRRGSRGGVAGTGGSAKCEGRGGGLKVFHGRGKITASNRCSRRYIAVSAPGLDAVSPLLEDFSRMPGHVLRADFTNLC